MSTPEPGHVEDVDPVEEQAGHPEVRPPGPRDEPEPLGLDDHW
ncbi:hypothetical protein Lfu02_04430 [Longispora fulva]|uniref:Uncharacterized protein n=1 Tax=Longispora fulva TaxID=619741 RepID=A0A8J7KF36_9ACTN|nr:hypothetical protein [Longispora fulva]MBG6135690.1 hypothetical protein [Longispora fulva]GIG56071.1 hypothetical protein Lfu02_04430 [Longispora fulva]